jgi:hypothetical protein
VSWLDASWADSTYDDAAEGDASDASAYALTPEQAAEIMADPATAPDAFNLPTAVASP